MYSKNHVAPFPPMGWNSYDYYNTCVNEEQVRANAAYMAEHMHKFGYDYVVIDIQWSDPAAGTDTRYQYIPFSRFCIDEWSRQIPAPNRFPSSAEGAGFKPLADYIHSLSLKFGIHIMRGIPRFACHDKLPIKTADGRKLTADMVANPASISKWNPDMYGVDYRKDGAQDYYDSIFELYASWGVDFVKVDDICNTNMYPHDPYSAEKEIEMMAAAIKKSGRPMVLSLSPGPAVIEKACHMEKYANMWRITDDFWDDWRLLKAMFERCQVWQNHTGPGCWPDCDMLPVGRVGAHFECFGSSEHDSVLTHTEQYTLMNLWCMFRSPLMVGAELTKLDDFTLSLLTNPEVLSLTKNGRQARQITRSNDEAAWATVKEDGTCVYAALFNISDEKRTVAVDLDEVYMAVTEKEAPDGALKVTDVWTGATADGMIFRLSGDGTSGKEGDHSGRKLSATLEPHASVLVRIER